MAARAKTTASIEEAAPPPAESPSIREVLAEHRKANGWTLAEVSRRTGVSISTLSKIENGQSQPAYSVLTRLTGGLDIDFADIFGGGTHPRFSGAARAITRAGSGIRFQSDMGFYEVLGNDLAAKSLTPMLIEIPPPTRNRPHVRSAHAGEEFVYVVEGEVVFEMSPYAPVVLSAGDSVYFDGASDHGFHSVTKKPSRILSVVVGGRKPPLVRIAK